MSPYLVCEQTWIEGRTSTAPPISRAAVNSARARARQPPKRARRRPTRRWRAAVARRPSAALPLMKTPTRAATTAASTRDSAPFRSEAARDQQAEEVSR